MAVSRYLLPALACAVLWTVTSWATPPQWKWRDANGRITVSDLPPPREVPAQDILQRPDPAASLRSAAPGAAASAPGTAGEAPKVDAELQARKQAAEAAEAERNKAETERNAQRRAENCRNARAHLAALNTGQRIARYNAQGEREILDDKQRAAEARRAQDVISSDCR
jgi:Domain of unknown function (DUF4124)